MTKVQTKLVTNLLVSVLERDCNRSHPVAANGMECLNQPVQTNNDVEGWHYRLNRMAQRACINIYLLFTLLYQEAQMVKVNMRLLSYNKARRTQRKSAVNSQMKLHKF